MNLKQPSRTRTIAVITLASLAVGVLETGGGVILHRAQTGQAVSLGIMLLACLVITILQAGMFTAFLWYLRRVYEKLSRKFG